MGSTDGSDWVPAWAQALDELGSRIRDAVRTALAQAHAGEGRGGDLAAAVGVGAGDVTFGIDAVAEAEVTRWLEEEAARRPLSLLTEDAGWRHRAPAPGGGSEEVAGFGHGGPRHQGVDTGPLLFTQCLVRFSSGQTGNASAAAVPDDGQRHRGDALRFLGATRRPKGAEDVCGFVELPRIGVGGEGVQIGEFRGA